MIRFPSPDVLRKIHPQPEPVTVSGIVTELDPDHHNHQVFTLQVSNVVENAGHAAVSAGELINVAVRYGDSLGLRAPVPGLALQQPITLRGDYIAAKDAYGEADGDQNAVIHFTHHPVGWVEYQGHRYA